MAICEANFFLVRILRWMVRNMPTKLKFWAALQNAVTSTGDILLAHFYIEYRSSSSVCCSWDFYGKAHTHTYNWPIHNFQCVSSGVFSQIVPFYNKRPCYFSFHLPMLVCCCCCFQNSEFRLWFLKPGQIFMKRVQLEMDWVTEITYYLGTTYTYILSIRD